MKKFNVKRIAAVTMAAMMAVSPMCVGASADEIGGMDITNEYHDKVNYISFSDYLEKYGEENIINGFNVSETRNNAEILGISTEAAAQNVNNEPNSVFESLSEGEFLGLELVSVSDLPPDDMNFSVKVKDNGFNSNRDSAETPSAPVADTNTIRQYGNYTVYYSDNAPGEADLNQAYEAASGTYVYKYGYALNGDYYCTTDVTFSGTELKCGTQNTNMYAYLAAKSSSQTLDFGLMANPSASNRNQGMYAFYNNGAGTFDVDPFPKVAAASSSGNVMTLANKTVQITLSVGTDGSIEMYMGIDGSMVYYKVITVGNITSGTSKALTFLQAMSCVSPDGVTSLTSGSYFKNVKFSNTKLYSYNSSSARTFSTLGSYTYYVFLAKPSKLSYSYTNSSETISIVYE